MAMLSATAHGEGPFTVFRSNSEAVGFDKSWIDSEEWCIGHLIYDITNQGDTVVNPTINAKWRVTLPGGISVSNPKEWGYTTTAGIGQTLSYDITNIGSYMSSAGTEQDTRRHAFALTLRCLAGQATITNQQDVQCSCPGLEGVVIDQDPPSTGPACSRVGWRKGDDTWECPAGFRLPVQGEVEAVTPCILSEDSERFSYFHDVGMMKGGCDCKWNGNYCDTTCGNSSIQQLGVISSNANEAACGDYDQLMICVQ
eukprot:gene21498-28479_t